jgi:hypothetical protein
MNYQKPEVAVLGDAVQVIENLQSKPNTIVSDGTSPKLAAAYDLDE